MFSGPRIVIIDDKRKHMEGLQTALDHLGYSNRAIEYSATENYEFSLIPGVRILLIDKTMTSGGAIGGSDDKKDFNVIADLISQIVCPDSGPYGLILWTEKPDNLDGLREVIDRTDGLPKPFFYGMLAKGAYMDTASGEIRDPAALQKDIEEIIGQSPQLRSLFLWEKDITAAQNIVLKSIMRLVSPDGDPSEELGRLLYKISEAEAGIGRGGENPKQSIERVLVSLLLDRLETRVGGSENIQVWTDAIIKPKDTAPDLLAAAGINTALHFEFPTTEKDNRLAPQAGTIFEIPADVDVKDWFGVSREEIFGILKINDKEVGNCDLLLVRIGAPCDDAQPNPGPIQHLLAIRWPFTNADGTRADGATLHMKRTEKRDFEWMSPTIQVGDRRLPGKFSVLLQMTKALTPTEISELDTIGRFRSELAESLTREYARYISRPGIITL